MTGFGKAAREFDGDTVSVEMSSVNHRYLECSVRLPNGWNALEPVVRSALKQHVARGKVSVTVNRKRSRSQVRSVSFDDEIARQYIEAAGQLNELLGSREPLSTNVLAQLEGVFYEQDAEEDLAAAEQVLVESVAEAAKRLNEMRAIEGRTLESDIRQRVTHMRAVLDQVESRLPELSRLYAERLRERVAELAADSSIAEDRIALEVALMADKSDVTEEVVRLKSHLAHAEEVIASGGSVGRRLDFLAQEIQREVNTLGVKTRDGDVAALVLDLKAELEKIREQVQNIE